MAEQTATGLGPGARAVRLGDLVTLAFTFLVAIAVIGVSYWRLYYGVDLTDESYYVAVPYRLVRGAHPFVDETGGAQLLAAFLIYPFIRAYYAVAGTTGMVLFVRNLQFLFSLTVSLAVIFALRSVLETRRAVLVGLAAVAFVPFGIHGLSYNTLGGGLFTAGCFLGFLSLREPERRATRILAGLCLGLAVFVYPPLVVAVATCYLIRFLLARGRARRNAIGYELPALALPVAGVAALFALVGPHQVLSDYKHARTASVRLADLHKLVAVAAHEWNTLRLWYLVLPALAILALTWRRQRHVSHVVLLALPLLVLPPRLSSYLTSLEYVAHYGWLALPLYIAVRQRSEAAQLLRACWFPALVAGITTSYSSTNGGVNFGIGFFPAAIVSSVFLIWSLDQSTRTADLPPMLLSRLAGAPAVAVIAFLLWFEVVPVYRDGALSSLHARIEQGPYAGLLTSNEKRSFLERLQLDLIGAGEPCRILFFNDFPAGYLLSTARPDTNSAWTLTVAPSRIGPYQDTLLRYYRSHGFPDVVVVMKRIPYAAGSARTERYRPKEPLLTMVHARPYRLAIARTDYLIYQRRATTCRYAQHARRRGSAAAGRSDEPDGEPVPTVQVELAAGPQLPRSRQARFVGSAIRVLERDE
jgi:hypothetical protein